MTFIKNLLRISFGTKVLTLSIFIGVWLGMFGVDGQDQNAILQTYGKWIEVDERDYRTYSAIVFMMDKVDFLKNYYSYPRKYTHITGKQQLTQKMTYDLEWVVHILHEVYCCWGKVDDDLAEGDLATAPKMYLVDGPCCEPRLIPSM